MSDNLANYSFLPWLRQGLSNNIPQADNDPAVKLRASIDVQLLVTPTLLNGTAGADESVIQNVKLYGPGDIAGIDSKAVVKVEPRNWITNFEPNYLPYIDFYEEDFPWRYTPAKAAGDRLRPWIALVVLSEDEFEDGNNMQDKPLPYFKFREGIKAADVFPKPEELWAWAHVHVNKDLSDGADPGAASESSVNNQINAIISSDPDNAYSRIICPRKLVENKGYHAFVVPCFETGRLAGLGCDIPSDTSATASAWGVGTNIEFPYYYRWYFRTGKTGDFEYLVNLLKPQPADKKVGVRDIDVIHPGSNLPGITNEDLNGVLKLGGALRVPFDTMEEQDRAEVTKYDEWDENPYPHAFTEAMANRINLADDYAKAFKTVQEANKDAGIVSESDYDSGDPDPVITSPLYGRWHALQERLLNDTSGAGLPHNKNWIHELNLDPRFRVASGLGTKVIQKGQEEYMQAAWEQVGDVIALNNKIRWAQVAKEVSLSWYTKHILPLETAKAYSFTAPVQKRVMYQSLTVRKHFEESKIPAVVSSGAFRSISRPRGRFMQRLNFTSMATPFNFAERINNDEVIILPPKAEVKGGINLPDIAEQLNPKKIPPKIQESLEKNKFLLYLFLGLAILFFILGLIFFKQLKIALAFLGLSALALYIYNLLKKWRKQIKDAEMLSPESFTPEAVQEMPKSPDFTISSPGAPSKFVTGGVADSPEATRFKAALTDVFSLTDLHFDEPVRKKINFNEVITNMVKSLHPGLTIPKRTWAGINIPSRIKDNFKEFFAPVMVYPEIDVPMYKPLADMSSEFFLPNIKLIPENSITLLENNQKFIESYMVGINHEMSRELLWREYPTDQRGSYFRQFWDVTSFLPPQPVPANIKEQLRDIPKIHTWSKINTGLSNPGDPESPLKNELGQHNLRAASSGKTQLVLVIRGELLKKYPTAVVYANKADWGLNTGGAPDVKEERRFAELTAAESLNPPTTKIKTPLFEAKVEPDVYFFGFDLDDQEARGTLNPTTTADDPGWFFVIKERPGEPRFGLDIEKAKNESGIERLINWNNLSWPDIGTADGDCIELNKTISFQTYNAAIDQENKPNPDDVQAKWSPSANAAELAYILYQVPVLVGVHASRMLPKKD